MSVRHLELADFRLFHVAQVDPEPEGTTVITGPNGTGKTSVLEALAYLGTRRSFRGAPPEALVRSGAPSAIIRADIDSADSPTLVEAEIRPAGRSRTRVNRKYVAGRKELGVAAPCTIFCPEDLAIISGGPSGRRDLLDDALSVLDPEEPAPRTRPTASCASGRPCCASREAATTGTSPARWTCGTSGWPTPARCSWRRGERLVADLEQPVGSVYARLAGARDRVLVRQQYTRSWEGDLLDALLASRVDDLRRGVNTVGPHRDDLLLQIDGREARTHASQGEQRCLALALRLGVHELVRARTPLVPTLLLDDVFSELDPARSRALVAELPPGQSILTTATPLPEGIVVARTLPVESLAR